MTTTYRIVEHDGGWAYRLGDVYSETFPSEEAALEAARRAAARQEAADVEIVAEATGRRIDATTGEELEKQRQDDRLEEGLEETFPASDPVSASQITRTGEPGEMAKKKS